MALINPTLAKPWLTIETAAAAQKLGRARHVLFDFDGTISILREGWEGVMVPLMVEVLSAGAPPAPALVSEVEQYVSDSTGILTLLQMEWLEQSARKRNIEPVLSAAEYKAEYLRRLMQNIAGRITAVQTGRVSPSARMVAGSADLLEALSARGARLYVASGTDDPDVKREARILGVDGFFEGGIFGAIDHNESNNKERIIQRILDREGLSGPELAVIGDGPVELREAARRGALAIGVASNEKNGSGWNPAKIDRLRNAGADILIADYTQTGALVNLLCGAA